MTTQDLAYSEVAKLMWRQDILDPVRFLERQLTQADGELDQGVYVLDGLTEEEIRIIEGG